MRANELWYEVYEKVYFSISLARTRSHRYVGVMSETHLLMAAVHLVLATNCCTLSISLNEYTACMDKFLTDRG